MCVFPQFQDLPAVRVGGDCRVSGRVEVNTDPAGRYMCGLMNFDHLFLPKFACGTNCLYTVTVSPVSLFLLSLLVIMHPVPLNLAVERPGLGKEMINRAGLCMRGIFWGIGGTPIEPEFFRTLHEPYRSFFYIRPDRSGSGIGIMMTGAVAPSEWTPPTYEKVRAKSGLILRYPVPSVYPQRFFTGATP